MTETLESIRTAEGRFSIAPHAMGECLRYLRAAPLPQAAEEEKYDDYYQYQHC